MSAEIDPRIVAVLSLYEQHGATAYLGEKVSKTDHMLQAARAAQAAGESERVVLACLLHDIGHFLEQDDMNGLGVRDHGRVGGDYLRSIGMDSMVCDMVTYHADAKRYLVATRSDYMSELSSASRRTLLYQGGRMSKRECAEFEQLPCFRGTIQVRLYDDTGKDTGIAAGTVTAFIPLLRKYFSPAVPPPPLDSSGWPARAVTGTDQSPEHSEISS